MAIKKLFKQTHCDRYYTNIDIFMLHYLTSEDIRHYVLDHLLCKVGYFLPLKSCLSRHTVLAILRISIQLCCNIWPVKIVDSMCYLIYCVKVGYFWPLKSGLIRHLVLAIPPRLIHYVAISYQWKHYTLCVR